MQRGLLLISVLVAFSLGSEAKAGCCDVVKLDPEAAPMTVRVCEPDAWGACATVLFEGDLALGGEAHVCTEGETVLYQERDVAGGEFGPPVTAVCDGSDVEI
jgi:hypothetical protein